MSYQMLLDRIDQQNKAIRDRRPLAPAEVKELDAYYRIGMTYSSNALEGNSLTITETKVLLEDGITAGGAPIRDCYEATGHAKAYDYMLEVARGGPLHFSEDVIRQLHALFYSGIDPELAGKYRDIQVIITGTEYVPPAAEDVPGQMVELVRELEEKNSKVHPVVLAAYAHRRLVDIHPFQDGNGRTARLLMNLILINKGYCLVSIPPVLRREYISALEQSRQAAGAGDPFVKFICECELEAQWDYCRMFHIKLPEREKAEPER